MNTEFTDLQCYELEIAYREVRALGRELEILVLIPAG